MKATTPSVVGRYLRFCLVGLSGLVVDSAVLWLLTAEYHWDSIRGKAVAAEIAVWTNFILNNKWTFGGRLQPLAWGALVRRFCAFNLVALSGIALSMGIMCALHLKAGLPLLLSNVMAVFLVSLWSFFVNCRWVWRSRPAILHK